MTVTVWKYPKRDEWKSIMARPQMDLIALSRTVSDILESVRCEGDDALRRYEKQFDRVVLDALQVTPAEMEEGIAAVPESLKKAIRQAIDNIRKFHASQAIEVKKVETSPGVWCWQKPVGIEKVGLYVPGGTAPLFSTVLMLAVPARLAGCHEIVMCTPPGKEGKIAPAILYAARETGIDRIFKLGGVQAIGAMAFGTESVPQVYKIFGPGNRFVTAAKQWVGRYGVAIDMPAGPSELMVVADESARATFVAADLLSQAEHGPDSQGFLVTCDESLIDRVEEELNKQLNRIPRKAIAEVALRNSKYVVLRSRGECVELVNCYAPEHLMLCVKDYLDWVPEIRNAGSVFLGHYSPESAGDYASGTNHTLPTNGYARAYSGVNMDAFMKKITFQEIMPEGLAYLGKTIEIMADNEKLEAHGNAVRVRNVESKI